MIIFRFVAQMFWGLFSLMDSVVIFDALTLLDIDIFLFVSAMIYSFIIKIMKRKVKE